MFLYIYLIASSSSFLIANGKILSLRSVQIQKQHTKQFQFNPISTVKCIRPNGRVLCVNVLFSYFQQFEKKKKNKLLLLLLCLTMKFSIHSGNKNRTKNLVGHVLNFKFKNMKRRRKKNNNHTIRTLHTRNTHNNNKQINKIPTEDRIPVSIRLLFLGYSKKKISQNVVFVGGATIRRYTPARRPLSN